MGSNPVRVIFHVMYHVGTKRAGGGGLHNCYVSNIYTFTLSDFSAIFFLFGYGNPINLSMLDSEKNIQKFPKIFVNANSISCELKNIYTLTQAYEKEGGGSELTRILLT